MAKITLFQDVNFGGRYLVRQQADGDLSKQSFNDLTSAVIVCSGTWILYRDVNYEGPQWLVSETGGPNGDGLYPSFKDWGGSNDSVSSLRPV